MDEMTKIQADEVLEQIAEYKAQIKAAEDERDEFIAHYEMKIASANDICDKATYQARQEIALLTEDRKGQGLVLAQSIRTNLIMSSFAFHSNGAFLDEKKIEETGQGHIDALRIKTPSIDEIVGQLSGGNQQKVVIGKWINSDADI